MCWKHLCLILLLICRGVYSATDTERLSLNFQDIEVRAALQILADFTGRNLVVSDAVQGAVTLRLENVRWRKALDVILRVKGLAVREEENILMVAPAAELAAQEQLAAKANQVKETLAPLELLILPVRYANAADLATLMQTDSNRLLSERGSVTVDPRTNALLVRDTHTSLNNLRQLIATLDRPVRQVMIESRIVIANDDFARELGVRFGFSGGNLATHKGEDFIVFGGGKPAHLSNNNYAPGVVDANGGQQLMVNLPATLGGGRGGAVNLLAGKLGRYMLQLELSAMQQEGRGEVISSPRVVTANQTKAVIKQGVEIPYQESTSSGATNVSFKEAVLKLEVTPQITSDGKVLMDLTVSKDNPDYSRSIAGVPPIDSRRVESRVLVANGETIVLGGIIEEVSQDNQEKIPLLGDLPGIGRLFRKDYTKRQKQELLVFITPTLLDEP